MIAVRIGRAGAWPLSVTCLRRAPRAAANAARPHRPQRINSASPPMALLCMEFERDGEKLNVRGWQLAFRAA